MTTETQIKSSDFQKFLEKNDACKEATEWVNGRNLKESYDQCNQADWILWIAAKMIGEQGWHTHKQVVLAACACAESVLHLVPKNEERPKKAIETARSWTKGEATIKEVRLAAANAADAANAAAYAYAAANAAANAADAANAANAAAKKEHHKKMCKIIRKILPCPKIKIYK